MTVTLLLLSSLPACQSGSSPRRALAEVDSAGGKGIRGAAIGERLLFGVTELQPRGDERLHLVSAELLDITPGLVVDEIWALRVSESGSPVGALRGGDVDPYRKHFHPITDVVLDPKCSPEAKCINREGEPAAQDWYLAAEVHIERVGRFETGGYEITYRLGGDVVAQSFRNWVIVVESA